MGVSPSSWYDTITDCLNNKSVQVYTEFIKMAATYYSFILIYISLLSLDLVVHKIYKVEAQKVNLND